MDILKYRSLHKQSDFDNLDVLIVFEDVETKQIVYKNKKFIECVDSFENKKPNYDNRFISIDSFVSEIDGKQVVVEVGEVIVPITNLENNTLVRNAISEIENDKRDAVQNDFIQLQHGIRTHDTIIDDIIKRTIKFYDSEFAHLFIFGSSYTEKGKLYQYKIDSDEVAIPIKVSLPSYWKNQSYLHRVKRNLFQRSLCSSQ